MTNRSTIATTSFVNLTNTGNSQQRTNPILYEKYNLKIKSTKMQCHWMGLHHHLSIKHIYLGVGSLIGDLMKSEGQMVKMAANLNVNKHFINFFGILLHTNPSKKINNFEGIFILYWKQHVLRCVAISSYEFFKSDSSTAERLSALVGKGICVSKQRVNRPSCTELLQLQHHFPKTRDSDG